MELSVKLLRLAKPRPMAASWLVAAILILNAMAALAQNDLLVWGTVPSPNRGSRASTLKGSAAISDNDIWAVGEFNPGIPPTETGRRTLIEHWNGTSWTGVPSPNPSWTGLDFATLEAVSGVSTDDVWAVGYSEDF